MQKYKHVRIYPWLGESYGQGIFKHRVLVLGESEYQVREGQAASKDDTRWCVRHVIKSDKQSAFFRNIATMFLGHTPEDKTERSRFWNSIVFYNYVQEHVGFGAGTRPTSLMWRGVAPTAFREVLRRHTPDYVLVLGFGNWNWLVRADRNGPTIRAVPPTSSKSRDIRQTYWYETNRNGEALAIAVKHPSRAFNALAWHRWLKAAVPDLFV